LDFLLYKTLIILSLLKSIKTIKFKQKTIYFIFFLLISSFLWLLVKLSQNYSTDITYPIEYKNYPENKININELPEFLNLKVKASGFEILKYKITSSLIPITFDISTAKLKKSKFDSALFYIETIGLLENINTQLSEKSILKDIKISEINPDTLFIQFTEMTTKKVAIKLNADITYSRQYM